MYLFATTHLSTPQNYPASNKNFTVAIETQLLLFNKGLITNQNLDNDIPNVIKLAIECPNPVILGRSQSRQMNHSAAFLLKDKIKLLQ